MNLLEYLDVDHLTNWKALKVLKKIYNTKLWCKLTHTGTLFWLKINFSKQVFKQTDDDDADDISR